MFPREATARNPWVSGKFYSQCLQQIWEGLHQEVFTQPQSQKRGCCSHQCLGLINNEAKDKLTCTDTHPRPTAATWTENDAFFHIHACRISIHTSCRTGSSSFFCSPCLWPAGGCTHVHIHTPLLEQTSRGGRKVCSDQVQSSVVQVQ